MTVVSPSSASVPHARHRARVRHTALAARSYLPIVAVVVHLITVVVCGRTDPGSPLARTARVPGA
jgi:hypothetical protein